MKQAQIPLGIGCLPPKEYTVYISPIPEYILGIDMLQGLCLETTAVEFRLRVHTVLRGHARHPPIALPVPRQVTNTKQYKLSGGHKEIGETLQELDKVGIIKPFQFPGVASKKARWLLAYDWITEN